MQFPELVKKVGLHLATAIFKEIAGQDFENKMSFADWQEVMKILESRETGKPYHVAREHLQPLARTYKEWEVVLRETYYKWDGELDEKTKVMDRLFSAITTIAECKDFHNVCKHEDFGGNHHWSSRYQLAIIEKAVRLGPQNFADWYWVFSLVKYEEDPTRALCIENIEKTAATFEEWLTVYQDYQCGEDLKKKAFEKLVELAR